MFVGLKEYYVWNLFLNVLRERDGERERKGLSKCNKLLIFGYFGWRIYENLL